MNKRNILVLVGGGIVILVIGILIGSRNSVPRGVSPSEPATITTSTSGTAATSAPSAKTTAPKTTTGTTLTRAEAYSYYSGKKLYTQLVDCVGYPSSFFFKVGTRFMVENNAPLPAALTIQSQSYIIPAKGFEIITASQSGVYNAICNGKIALRLQVSPN